MKKITFLVIIAILASCVPERTSDQVSVEISKTRNEIAKLNQKLETLEEELAGLTTGDNISGVKITAIPASTGNFTDFIQVSGTVEAVNSAAIMPQIGGKIEAIHVTEGAWVTQGDKLLTLDTKIMDRSLAEMETGYGLAKTMYEKQKELWEQGIGSELQYIQAKNQKEQLERTMETLRSQRDQLVIVAPFTGRIEKVYLKAGESASPGRAVIELVNTGQLYVNTEVSEAFIETVHRGDTAWLEFPNLPDFNKTARLSFVSQVINPQNRTFSIRVEIANPGGEIKPNMLATLKLKVFEEDDVLIVPTILIRQDYEGSFLYTVHTRDGKQYAAKTYVTTGSSDGLNSVVTSGLNTGDLIVNKGYNKIKDGSLVDLIN